MDFLAPLAAEIRKIPPVTRFLCASLVSVTTPVLMNLISGYKVLYHWRLVFGGVLRVSGGKFEIWRLWSSFFMGSGGLSFIFEMIMLYRTGNELESGPYVRASSDLAWQLFIASGAIIVSSVPVGSFFFFRPLLLCLVYLSSQLAPPGAQTSLYGIVTIPIKYFPFALLGLDLLNGGPKAAAQSLPGALVGHLWWWAVWSTGGRMGGEGGPLREWGRAPAWITNWFGERRRAVTDAPGAGQGANSGAATGIQVVPPRRRAEEGAPTTHGHRWGAGQRLGN